MMLKVESHHLSKSVSKKNLLCQLTRVEQNRAATVVQSKKRIHALDLAMVALRSKTRTSLRANNV